jgi:chromosome segregation ATPase
MDKHVAIKKVHQILGKGFGYRENPKAGTKDDREKAKAELKGANAERDRLRAALEAKKQTILSADAEYQKALATYREARKRVEALSSKSHSYRVTVGNTHSAGGFGFFSVMAEGDNWEEVLEKVTKK